jgi:hypothetical protein
MTVPSENRRAGPYTGNGVTTSFSFSFRILAATHLRVVITDLDGVDDDADPSEYSVTFDDEGGSITYPLVGAPLATGYKLTILRSVPKTQSTDIANAGAFYPQVHEDVFDKLTMLIQELAEENDRALRVSASDTTTDTENLAAQLLEAASDATDAQTAAAASASAAAASAAAASALVDSVAFQDVVFLTSASSPYSVTQAQNGTMLSVDTSGGNVTINLPQISSLTLPFTLGIKKATGDGNSITVNRGGTDTIDGGTTKTIAVTNSGATFFPDTDTAPDRWTTADFGAVGGNITVDAFTGDGVRTTDTLSIAPGSKNNTIVVIGGVPQLKSTYTISGITLTYGAAPGNGVPIEVWIGTTLAIGTPADGTVNGPKIVDGSVTPAKLSTGAPTWDASGNLVANNLAMPADGRLTLTSGTPVTTGNVTGATSIFYTPFIGNRIALYDGTRWQTYNFNELTLALTGLAAITNFDVFIYNNAGTLTLETTAWASNTARATALVYQDGVLVRSGATTRRYLGSFRTTSTIGQTESTNISRRVFNAYNRVPRELFATETADSWTYTLATWRQANNSTGNQISYMNGLAEDSITVLANLQGYSTTGIAMGTGIGINSTSANSAQFFGGVTPGANQGCPIPATYVGVPPLGWVTIALLENSVASGTTTRYGDNGIPTQMACGLATVVRA